MTSRCFATLARKDVNKVLCFVATDPAWLPSAPPPVLPRVSLYSIYPAPPTNMQLCVIEQGAWQGMFPRVPSRSGGMVVVQTGVLGTLMTGFAVSVARALAPAGEVVESRGGLRPFAT